MLKIVIVISIVYCRIVAASPDAEGAGYIYGELNSQVCPRGFQRILSLKDCLAAASALGVTRVYQGNDHGGPQSDVCNEDGVYGGPRGCVCHIYSIFDLPTNWFLLPDADVQQLAKDMLSWLDKDGDGKATVQEIIRNSPEAAADLRVLDANADGEVELKEIIAFAEARKPVGGHHGTGGKSGGSGKGDKGRDEASSAQPPYEINFLPVNWQNQYTALCRVMYTTTTTPWTNTGIGLYRSSDSQRADGLTPGNGLTPTTTSMTSSSFLSATAATVDTGKGVAVAASSSENNIGMLVGIVAGTVATLASVGMCYIVFRHRRSQEAAHVAAGVGAAVAKTEPAGHPPRGDGARRANQKLSEEEQDVQQNCSTKLKFFSTLRFEEAKPRAKAMKAALEEYENVECYLCSVGNGHNIQQDIWANYDEAQCAIVYGTTTYGMKTTEVAISTFDEMNMIMEDKKPFFLLKLCDKFELAPTRASFPKTVAYEDCQGWIDGPPPETVVAEVLRCGAAAAGVPVPVLKMDSLRSTASLAESLGPDNLDTFV